MLNQSTMKDARLILLTQQAVTASRRLGHAPTQPQRDDPDGFSTVSQCQWCGRSVCVDLAEGDEPYGSGVTEPCTETHRRLMGRRFQ